MAPWAYNPHTGGVAIPPGIQERTRQRILVYTQAHYAGKYTHIDAYTEPDLPPDFSTARFS